MSKFKLFCLPYAGGSAMVYKSWLQYLNPDVELIPLELSGRGNRVNEPLYRNLEIAVDDLFDIIKKHIVGLPYAFFGHSMGAMLAYELAHKIQAHKFPNPSHIFFSGRGAPHIKRLDKKKYHLMNDTDFKNEVIKLGGTPPEFFDHPELIKLFIPILKNDFKISETEVLREGLNPIESNISVLFGKQEDLTLEQRDAWKAQSLRKCDIKYFEGGHFFLNVNVEEIVNFINQKIINYI